MEIKIYTEHNGDMLDIAVDGMEFHSYPVRANMVMTLSMWQAVRDLHVTPINRTVKDETVRTHGDIPPHYASNFTSDSIAEIDDEGLVVLRRDAQAYQDVKAHKLHNVREYYVWLARRGYFTYTCAGNPDMEKCVAYIDNVLMPHIALAWNQAMNAQRTDADWRNGRWIEPSEKVERFMRQG